MVFHPFLVAVNPFRLSAAPLFLAFVGRGFLQDRNEEKPGNGTKRTILHRGTRGEQHMQIQLLFP